MPFRTRLRFLVALVGLFALLAACGDDGSDTTAAPASRAATTGAGTLPVTMKHAFGETTIAKEPTRVVAWGWGSADAAIALGVVPVAIPFQTYGADSNGVLPWIRERLQAQGVAVPTVLPNTSEVPFEAIAAAKPDLILAVYSGITAADYKLLSNIAPTVAYPGEAWSTPWRDTIKIVGTALGRDAKADEILRNIDVEVAKQAAAHPELKGKSVAMVWDTGEKFYVYKPADARVAFTLDLGMVSAPSVTALATDESTFFFTISKERLGDLKSDVLVNYADTPQLSQSFLTSPPAQLMDQVKRGTVAEVTGTEFIASVSPPTALSLTWGLDEYVAALAKAAKAADKK